jgi:hypothetical protein
MIVKSSRGRLPIKTLNPKLERETGRKPATFSLEG